jgi:hypothetical protein
MAYNKFTIKDLESKFNLNVIQQRWLPQKLEIVKADELLLSVLRHAEEEALMSEKARSEFVIAPMLQAFRRRNADICSLFSGYEFNVDKSIHLAGYCDFIVSLAVQKRTIEAPVVFVVETKKMDIDDRAIAQCGAEMFAANVFNEKAGKPRTSIFGCVTSAFSWCFLKLEGKQLTIDPNYVALSFDNPHAVLTVLQWCLEQSIENE